MFFWCFPRFLIFLFWILKNEKNGFFEITLPSKRGKTKNYLRSFFGFSEPRSKKQKNYDFLFF